MWQYHCPPALLRQPLPLHSFNYLLHPFIPNANFMRTKLFTPFFLLLTVFIISCNRSYVSLDSTNAKGEVAQLTNLRFRFSEPVMADSLLNEWDSTAYISFEPRIKGRFRWESRDELVFSPSEPLLPATAYKASIRDEVLRFSEYDRVKDADKISFYTAPLQLHEVQASWVLQSEGSQVAVPQLSLHFNYAVNGEEIKDKLAVKSNGTSVPFTLQTLAPSDVIVLRLNGMQPADRDMEVVVALRKGAKPVKGSTATTEDATASAFIPSPLTLKINNVTASHDGTEGVVRIRTSQQLVQANFKDLIRFEPAVAFTTEWDDFGLVLRSAQFDAEESYALTVAKGLRGTVGGVLREAYDGSVAFGALESTIRFSSAKAVYLSKRGSGNIEVRITNTPKVRLIISKIYENNLLNAERNGYYPQAGDDDEAEYVSMQENYIDPTAGDILFNKIIDTRTLPNSGNGKLLNLKDFEDRLPDVKGIYHVMVRSTEEYWISDSRFVSFSDLGLIAKQGGDKMLVFANSIKTAQSVEGVTINVYGANNQLLATGATNSDGVAEMPLPQKDFAGYRAAMVVAKTADDFNYLPFNNTAVNTSRFEVGGKRMNAAGLDAFVYTPRDIYRPGEKIDFAVVLRDREWKSPGTIPVKMKVLMPNGKELKSFRKNLNDEGAVEGSVDVSTAAITGSYLLEVYSATDVLLASKNFMVEEFVPDRIKVSAQLSQRSLKPGDATTLAINAVNFFGPPAANRAYETEIQVVQKKFAAKAFANYDFTLANQQSFFDKQLKEGNTDAAGNAAISFEVPALYRNTGLLEARFFTTVFDETGRPVSRHVAAPIYTQDVFHGIQDDGYSYYAQNAPVAFKLASVNASGVAVDAVAKVQVIKREYRTVLTKSGSYFRYDSRPEDKLMMDKEMNIGNATVFQFIPRSPGDYELRIYRPGAAAYVSKKFYSYGSWGADNSPFEVSTEGQIDISLDKETYSMGEKAKVLFKTPFSGRMLVTTERDGVQSYQYLSVSGRSASLEIDLKESAVPNVYVTATLFKPHEVSGIPLTVAHGFKNVPVNGKDRRLAVSINAPKSSRSKTKQTVVVKAAPGSMVSLAAVDNGVLQVSGFKTPDPYDHYYQKRALGVAAYDLYPLLFPELRARLSSTGGDGNINMEKRVNPMPARRFKIMSYWSGLQKANSNGEARFQFDVPQFSGQIRLMAVAVKGGQFGAAESATTIADPVVLSSALPRFLSPGDTVLVPVTVSNTTGKAANATAALSVSGPVQIVGGNTQSILLQPSGEAQVQFRLAAANTINVAKVAVQVKAMGETFTEETELSVRPPSTLQQITGSGSVVGGNTQKITMPVTDFLAGSTQYELVVSRSPVAELAGQLQYLVQYPYGCTEQTISAAFPQLYYADFSELIQTNNQRRVNATANVLEAIRKIKMRQLYNGALTLWDTQDGVVTGGGAPEHWWTTAYAAHFLLEARKAGFDVDNSLLETMLGYLSERLKARQTITYYYNRDQNRKIAPKEVPYSLYVLSLAGRMPVSTMNYYKANPQMLALDGRYLLSAAYAVGGDKKSFAALLPKSFSGEESVQQTGGSLYSATRDEGLALNALLQVDPGNAQVPQMARNLTQRLKTELYLNTQERAFAFLALGKIARTAARSTATAEVRSGGKVVAKIDGADWRGGGATLQNGAVEIGAKGSGRLYYWWRAQGISASGAYKEEDNFIKVRRQYFDRNGRPLSGNTFTQNDLVIVGVSLEKAYNGTIENVVLTDLLPAGFEIENPRTKDIPGMDWIKDAAEPTAMDVRDDRIHFFVDATRPKQTYYYAVRAVSPGLFKQGPVSGEALYDGASHSYHGAGLVQVVRR
ncbi:alpha-2-macroglobulin family protein [Paracnuella aquatica]|nr:alpha-2-macroglobulin family protein [Paracnuella aquatica]